MALPAFTRCMLLLQQTVSHAGQAHSSNPAAAQQMNRRTTYRFIDPALHTMRAVPTSNATGKSLLNHLKFNNLYHHQTCHYITIHRDYL